MQYLNVHIDAHEVIMSTYSKQDEFDEFDTMKMWLEGRESNGVLQALKEKYDTSYYDALRMKDDTNAVMKNISNNKTVRYKRQT